MLRKDKIPIANNLHKSFFLFHKRLRTKSETTRRLCRFVGCFLRHGIIGFYSVFHDRKGIAYLNKF